MTEPMSPATKGVLLGLANLVVIAACAGFSIGSYQGPIVATAMVFVGFLPAMLAGALLGLLAGALDGEPPIARVFVLAVLAIASVSAIGLLLQMFELIVPAFIPTVATAAVLERWTRPHAPLPVAVVTDRLPRGDGGARRTPS